MVEGVVLFEALDNVVILVVLDGAGVHECAVTDAVILKLPLILLTDPERLKRPVIFEFKTRLHGAVLHETEHLEIELRIFDSASISAQLLVLNFYFADIAAVLDFDEIDIDDEAADFDHVTNNLVERHLFKHHNSVVGLEIVDFFLDAAYHLQVRFGELQLCVDIQVVRYFAKGVYHQDHAVL